MTNTNPEDRITFLDHIRGIAILLVVAHHSLEPSFGTNYFTWLGWLPDFSHLPRSFFPLLPFAFGWSGVAIFFVVSGFCIHLSHERAKNKALKFFFIRRLFRIYPPYLLALCLFAFVVPHAKLSGSPAENARQFISHLFMVFNFRSDLVFGINGSFWSIATEFQLYLLYPVLLALVRRWGWKGALWLAAGFEIPLRTAYFLGDLHCAGPYFFFASPLFYWFSWAIGAKLADDWLKGRPLFLQNVPMWVFPTATLVSLFVKPLCMYSFLFFALSTTRLIAAWIVQPADFISQPRFGSDLLRKIGIISFSLYLLHQPFLFFVPDALHSLFPKVYFHPLKIFAITFGGVGGAMCLVSWVFYRFVELPSIDVGKWIVKKLAPPAAPAHLPVHEK